MRNSAILATLLLLVVGAAPNHADEPGDAAIKARNDEFAEKFSGAVLNGQFTVDGKPLDQLKAEKYEIVRAKKLPKGDQWSIEARIKYGKYDLVVPVPVDIKWAGKTPVITLDDITIPGMGTFSARVLLHKDRYAGTWQHDAVGGHMFGAIERPSDKPPTKPGETGAKVQAPVKPEVEASGPQAESQEVIKSS